jgi:hypothetical protein
MIGLVCHAADHPDGECSRDHHLRPVAADRSDDVPAQSGAFLDGAVAVIQELDDVDPNFPGAGALLRLAQRSGLVGVHGVDSGLTPGSEQIGHLLALGSPTRDS